MSWFKSKDSDYYDILLDSCNEEKKELETKITKLESELALLRQELQESKSKFNVYSNIENEPYVFNFNSLIPFSIERTIDENGNPITCIGYFSHQKNKSVAKEWYIRCSSKKHKELVNEFKRVLNELYSHESENPFEFPKDGIIK